MAAGFTKPYVDALLAVAGSAEATSALLPDLDAFARTLGASPDLREVLRNPSVERAHKAAVWSVGRHQLEVGLVSRQAQELDVSGLRRLVNDRGLHLVAEAAHVQRAGLGHVPHYDAYVMELQPHASPLARR